MFWLTARDAELSLCKWPPFAAWFWFSGCGIKFHLIWFYDPPAICPFIHETFREHQGYPPSARCLCGGRREWPTMDKPVVVSDPVPFKVLVRVLMQTYNGDVPCLSFFFSGWDKIPWPKQLEVYSLSEFRGTTHCGGHQAYRSLKPLALPNPWLEGRGQGMHSTAQLPFSIQLRTPAHGIVPHSLPTSVKKSTQVCSEACLPGDPGFPQTDSTNTNTWKTLGSPPAESRPTHFLICFLG